MSIINFRKFVQFVYHYNIHNVEIYLGKINNQQTVD